MTSFCVVTNLQLSEASQSIIVTHFVVLSAGLEAQISVDVNELCRPGDLR